MNYPDHGSVPYVPGVREKIPEPLAHFVPPVPDGVVSHWLQDNIPPGAWILDPFGASPRLAVEAARSGYRLLVTANNPIARFVLEMTAVPPEEEGLKIALAELAASYKGDERIEPHIRSLYTTICARCGQNISADSFYWDHDSQAPYMRVYTCPACGDSGEYPCTPIDIEQATQFSGGGLHKARALERVVPANDPDRIHVEQALSVYQPRTLYALITIINKLEGLNLPLLNQKYLDALLLYAFDQTNAMWRVPGSRERRRQLTIPKHFREINVWLALERGIEFWRAISGTGHHAPLAVSIWPNLPPSEGGICIYEGRLISIVDSLSTLGIKSVCTAIPRPNQAYWTLSALWAGWLWGREAVGTFKSVLHRQRYDWGWHTNALYSIFKQLANVLEPSTVIFGLLGEAEPGYVASALVAAGTAGCKLQGIALRTEENQAQITWTCQNEAPVAIIESAPIEAAINSARQFLESRGEPGCYLNTFTSAVEGIIQKITEKGEALQTKPRIDNAPSRTDASTLQNEPAPSLVYSSVYSAAREALTYRSGFLHYNLEDLSDLELGNQAENLQNTLFSLDVAKTNLEESGQINIDDTQPGSEGSLEKERSTRSSDVSESDVIWLHETEAINHLPISDRYEATLLSYLQEHQQTNYEEIDQAICDKFTGLYTPDSDFINLCLESYAEPEPVDRNRWRLRQDDEKLKRQADITDIIRDLKRIGDQLGVVSSTLTDGQHVLGVSWTDSLHELDYHFFPMTTTLIGELVLFGLRPSNRGFIVLPASRANLILYKLRHDPRLNKAFSPKQGIWRCLKFRHVRSLAENPLLSRENLDQLLGLDPLTYTTPQLRLI